MAELAGKNGGIYTSPLVVEDCEDAWDESVDADVTESADGTDYKVGAASAKFVCAAGLGAGDIVATEVISKDLTGYDTIMAWVKSSVNLATGDWQLMLDDTASCASPLKSLDLPALVAGTWTRVLLDLGDASGLGSLISIGLKQIVDKGAMNFWIDDVQGLALVDGVKSWTLDYVTDALEVTDFDDGGVRAYIPGCSAWSGSFEGNKDGAPLGIGSEVRLALAESVTSGQCWLGLAIITAVHPSASFDSVVAYGYDFQGTEALEVASV